MRKKILFFSVFLFTALMQSSEKKSAKFRHPLSLGSGETLEIPAEHIEKQFYNGCYEALKLLSTLRGREERLFCAASFGEIQKVKELLEQGADPNYRRSNYTNGCKPTVLHEAHPVVVPLLIQKGADVRLVGDEADRIPSAFGKRLHFTVYDCDSRESYSSYSRCKLQEVALQSFFKSSQFPQGLTYEEVMAEKRALDDYYDVKRESLFVEHQKDVEGILSDVYKPFRFSKALVNAARRLSSYSGYSAQDEQEEIIELCKFLNPTENTSQSGKIEEAIPFEQMRNIGDKALSELSLTSNERVIGNTLLRQVLDAAPKTAWEKVCYFFSSH